MGFFDYIKEGIKNHFDKKKEDREMVEKWQKEVDLQKQQIFEDEFKKNALEVARGEAKKDAASKSGLQKLRATNRLRNLENNNMAPGSFFNKLSEYTQKNLAKRQENMKKTDEMRATAKKMREETKW
ncbi:hypothetical protein LCGC14_2998350 [marine sediment metagenome]|uniref:Uncharacterized protein n=1 Tax=marine sediment metagenome TaxID=412755 RepID=A0A0F8XPC5_9ZZZZ